MDTSWVATVGAWSLVGAGSMAAALVGGLIGGGVVGLWRDRSIVARLDSLDARFNRLNMAGLSASGVDARTKNAEEMEAAMAFFMERMNADDAPKGADGKVDMLAVGLETAKRYPGVAMKQLSKLMAGKGLKGLGGLGKLMGG